MLRLAASVLAGSQVGAQRAVEQLEQHLEADAGDGGVVAALGELVADEGVWERGRR